MLLAIFVTYTYMVASFTRNEGHSITKPKAKSAHFYISQRKFVLATAEPATAHAVVAILTLDHTLDALCRFGNDLDKRCIPP